MRRLHWVGETTGKASQNVMSNRYIGGVDLDIVEHHCGLDWQTVPECCEKADSTLFHSSNEGSPLLRIQIGSWYTLLFNLFYHIKYIWLAVNTCLTYKWLHCWIQSGTEKGIVFQIEGWGERRSSYAWSQWKKNSQILPHGLHQWDKWILHWGHLL